MKMIKKEHIEFVDPPDHINKFLTHWTGSKKKNDQDAFWRIRANWASKSAGKCTTHSAVNWATYSAANCAA